MSKLRINCIFMICCSEYFFSERKAKILKNRYTFLADDTYGDHPTIRWIVCFLPCSRNPKSLKFWQIIAWFSFEVPEKKQGLNKKFLLLAKKIKISFPRKKKKETRFCTIKKWIFFLLFPRGKKKLKIVIRNQNSHFCRGFVLLSHLSIAKRNIFSFFLGVYATTTFSIKNSNTMWGPINRHQFVNRHRKN